MKNNFIILILSTLLFASCEKVIDVDLNNAAPQIVIEANLQEGTHDFKVHITQTASYFENQPAPVITDATVTLHDAINNIVLNNLGNGWYQIDNYTASSNLYYDLTVTVNGKSYEANSYMPPAVTLDTLTYEFVNGTFGSETGYQVTTKWKDPAGVQNYYRVITSKNNMLQSTNMDLLVFEDRLSDGLEVKVPLYNDVYELNDTVEVALISIDKKTYDYFNTLSQVVMNNSGTAPANPNTNFSGGALGYFAAISSSSKKIIIK